MNFDAQDRPAPAPVFRPSLSGLQILAYGALMLPLSMGWVTLMMFIPTYYAVDLQLGLGLVGILFAAGRVFDIIIDPVVGILSDRSRGRFGPRKPWIFAGLPLFCLAAWLLLSPPQGAGAAYLLPVACLYFLSFTLSEIPLAAMGLEISSDTHERTVLAASKTMFLILGGIAGAAAPLIWTESPQQALSNVSVMIIAVSALVLPLHLWLMPSRAAAAQPRSSLKDALSAFKDNRAVQRIIGVFFLLITAKSFGGALSLLYISYILQMPDMVGLFWIATGLGMLGGLPIWIGLSRISGKVRVWRMATVIGVMAYISLLFLGPGDKTAMCIISLIIGISGVADSIISVSLLADEVGAAQDKGRAGSAGLVTAVKNALSKLSVAVPMLIAFPLLGYMGLTDGSDTIAKASEIAPATQFALVSLYAGVPLTLKIIAFFAMARLRKGPQT